MSEDPVAVGPSPKVLPLLGVSRNVALLGIVSFFADLSSEMIYPLVPIFLVSVLGAPATVVGVIEGIAEGTASLMKFGAGWWSDRVHRRLPLVASGYGLAVIGKLLLALATAWPVVLVARFVDRLGKGIRGSPRDALIADSTAAEHRGRAFGLHRSMDTAGAVVGPLLGLLLVAVFDERLRLVFLIAVIPGLVSVGALAFVKESSRGPLQIGSNIAPSLAFGSLDRRLNLFLLAAVIFALGNSSDVFLVLRARDLGLSTTAAVLAYVVYNVTYMAGALPAGIVSDRIGRRTLFILGLSIFALVYAGFAIADRPYYVWPLFAVYGLYIALTQGIGTALLTDLAPPDRRASVVGLYGTLTGVIAVLSSIIAGVLWDRVGVAAPFALGAATALLSALFLTAVPGWSETTPPGRPAPPTADRL